MAQRRMFSLKITDSDMFTEMPLSAQCLYFHLAMHADDEGFVDGVKRIRRMIGASEDDLKILLLKKYVIPFQSGVCVIRHWRIHNYIQKDRFTPSVYQHEKAQLGTDKTGMYIEGAQQLPGDAPNNCPRDEHSAATPQNADAPAVNNAVHEMDTECIHDVSKTDTQVRLGKDRLELGEDRLGEVRTGKREIQTQSLDTQPPRESAAPAGPVSGGGVKKVFIHPIVKYARENLKALSRDNAAELTSFLNRGIEETVIKRVINTACAYGSPTYGYVRSVLSRYMREGIRTISDADADDKAFKGASSPERFADKQKPANDYIQHDYTAEDFGADFFYNPLNDYPAED